MNDQDERFRWLRTWGMGIMLYVVVCLGVLILLFVNNPWSMIAIVPLREPSYWPFIIRRVWIAAIFGGFGGTVKIIYTFPEILLGRKNDEIYFNIAYYLPKPIMGYIFGIIVSLLGFVILQLIGNGLESNRYISLIVLLASYLAGYYQRFIIKRVKQLIQRFTPQAGSQEV